jgi:hypothetical protein
MALYLSSGVATFIGTAGLRKVGELVASPLEYQSRVSRALKGTASVRTTVPETVARLIGAGPGSVLRWVVVPGSLEVTVSVKSLDPGKKKASKRD